eukprot:TRINITY_DN15662_c0_g1_i1.p1 TRINITY_DN15662_c0_g1~~TRINITY_DN15662_c0_g1_i1.p1  ORF type:complete len:126 (-),score=38.82 TRINITY_DN15662_c0_g1_i1:26-403(-)
MAEQQKPEDLDEGKMSELKTQFANQQQAAEQKKERRQALLQAVLTTDAFARLQRISMVRPQQAGAIEEFIERQFQSGQLRTRVTESALVNLLEKIAAESQTSVEIQRKGYHLDSSEDEDDAFAGL